MLILIGIIAILAIYFIISYNKVVQLKEQVKNTEKEIAINLDRRGKVFDSLTAMVKKSMDYEKSTLKEVIDLRNKIITVKAENPEEAKQLEEQLSEQITSGKFTSALNMTMEAYPELKANTNMLQFQEEVVSTENKLSYAKQAYNASIEEYNATIASIPYNYIVDKFPKLKENFEYWTIPDEKIKEHEDRRVEF